MKKTCLTILVLGLFPALQPLRGDEGEQDAEPKSKTHLFILAGQSNMVRLDPETSFAPALRKALPGDRILMVKEARNGVAIRRWHKQWQSAKGKTPKKTGDLYDKLMENVRVKLDGQNPATITFLWMQGERDAWEKHGEVYADSLRGLVRQLQNDLEREDINVVIGRISDFDLVNRRYAHWTLIREAQMRAANACPWTTWVDTDDLNGSRNELHYTQDGYRILGERFAQEALLLIRKRNE